MQAEKEKDCDAVIKKGEEVRALYPQYVYDANPYEFIAEADLAKDDKKAAAAILTDYEKLGGRIPALKQLASLEKELGQPKDAAATLDRLNYIYPVRRGFASPARRALVRAEQLSRAPFANTPRCWP